MANFALMRIASYHKERGDEVEWADTFTHYDRKLKQNIKIAWDLSEIDLEPKLREVVKYIKPHHLTCYVLVGFNSTMEQDLHRLEVLRGLRITPFVMVYRDPDSNKQPSRYCKDLARWVNKPQLFKSVKFEDYKPRKGFRCSAYFQGGQY